MIDQMTNSHSIQIKDSQKGWTMFKPIYTETVRTPSIPARSQSDLVGSECSSGSRTEASNSIRQTRSWSRETLQVSPISVLKSMTDIRAAFDFVSGYKPYHVPDSILAQSPLPIERLRREGKILSDRQWLLRIIVLESVAGVPGMVGGTLRHLRSLRLLVRTILFTTRG
jgi:hypothetical protein